MAERSGGHNNLVGLLETWDRRNQRRTERENAVTETVKPGVVAFSSLRGAVPLGIVCVLLVVAVVRDPSWIGLGALAVAAVAAVLAWLLVRDGLADAREWRSRWKER